MRAHAEAHGKRLEILLLLVHAVPGTPPPSAVDKGTMGGVHQSDDAVIDTGRKIGRQVSCLELIPKGEDAGDRDGRLNGFRESCSRRWWIRDEHPNVTVLIPASVASGVDAIDLQGLVRSKGRNEPALSAVRIEPPTVIAAFHFAVLQAAVGKRHAAVRAGVVQGERLSSSIAPENQGRLEKQGFGETVRDQLPARHGPIPEAEEHQRVEPMTIGRIRFSTHTVQTYHSAWTR